MLVIADGVIWAAGDAGILREEQVNHRWTWSVPEEGRIVGCIGLAQKRESSPVVCLASAYSGSMDVIFELAVARGKHTWWQSEITFKIMVWRLGNSESLRPSLFPSFPFNSAILMSVIDLQ